MIQDADKINFSFAGCGFLGIYHVGAASCLKQYLPEVVKNNPCSGASAGAIAAVLLLADGSLNEIAQSLINCAKVSNSRPLGPFSPSVNIHSMLREDLDRILPSDAHVRVNGKLRISLTKISKSLFGIVPTKKENMIVSHFNSREEVLDAVMAATFIPWFSGLKFPTFRGDTVIDGGLTDNCPGLDAWTIRINPYVGDAHISPKEPIAPTLPFSWLSFSMDPLVFNISNTSFQFSWTNISRLKATFLPPLDPKTLGELCTQGFTDTLGFLRKRFWIPIPPENSIHLPCLLPSRVQEVFEEDNQNFTSGPLSLRKIYSYTPARVLNIFNLPLFLGFEVVILAGSRVVQQPLVQEALTPFYTIQPMLPRNFQNSPRLTSTSFNTVPEVFEPPSLHPPPAMAFPTISLTIKDVTLDPSEFSEEVVEDYYSMLDGRESSILIENPENGEILSFNLSRRPSFLDLEIVQKV